MYRIQVNPDLLSKDSYMFKNSSEELSRISCELNNILCNLNWEVRSKSNVENMVRDAINEAKYLSRRTNALGELLLNASVQFEAADKQGVQDICKIGPINDGISMIIPGIKDFFIGERRCILPITSLGWITGAIGVTKTGHNGANNTGNSVGTGDGQNSSINDIEKRLQELEEIEKENGFIPNTKSPFNGQCFGFASQVFKNMFGVDLSGCFDSKKMYQLNTGSNGKVNIIPGGQLISNGTKTITGTDIENLLKNAKPGDFVQMKWTPGINYPAGPHSAIFGGIKDDKIIFYDANMDNKNGIEVHEISFEKYAQTINNAGDGVTIYTPAN